MGKPEPYPARSKPGEANQYSGRREQRAALMLRGALFRRYVQSQLGDINCRSRRCRTSPNLHKTMIWICSGSIRRVSKQLAALDKIEAKRFPRATSAALCGDERQDRRNRGDGRRARLHQEPAQSRGRRFRQPGSAFNHSFTRPRSIPHTTLSLELLPPLLHTWMSRRRLHTITRNTRRETLAAGNSHAS